MAGFSSVPQFLARLILGIIFIAHGWQKLHTNGCLLYTSPSPRDRG